MKINEITNVGKLNGMTVMSLDAFVDGVEPKKEVDENDVINELKFKGSQCTQDCSGHMAGYEWSMTKAGKVPNSHSPSFNKGAAIQRAGIL